KGISLILQISCVLDKLIDFILRNLLVTHHYLSRPMRISFHIILMFLLLEHIYQRKPGVELAVPIANGVYIIFFLKIPELSELIISVVFQEIQPVGEIFFRNKQTLFIVDSFFARFEDNIVVFTHNNGFFGAHLLAIAAVNTAQHINFEKVGISFFGIVGILDCLPTLCNGRGRSGKE